VLRDEACLGVGAISPNPKVVIFAKRLNEPQYEDYPEVVDALSADDLIGPEVDARGVNFRGPVQIDVDLDGGGGH
jgi:hypothetical protein